MVSLKTWFNLKDTLSQEVCNGAEELQMLHPFPPVICFYTTAVPVLCSQLTHPEMLLVMEICTELVQSGLCFWWQYPLLLCHSQRRWVNPCVYSTGTSCSTHRNQKWQIYILFQFSIEGYTTETSWGFWRGKDILKKTPNHHVEPKLEKQLHHVADTVHGSTKHSHSIWSCTSTPPSY